MNGLPTLAVGDVVWVSHNSNRITEQRVTKVSRTHYTIDEQYRVPIAPQERLDQRARTTMDRGYSVIVYLDHSLIDEQKWLDANRYRIAQAVERADIAMLKRIDAMLTGRR